MFKTIAIGAAIVWGTLFGQSQPSAIVGGTFQTSEVRALFETTLASRITSSATSFTLTSATDKDGTALASSTYGFIIDEGTSVEEMVLADCTSTTCTNVTRGLSVRTGTSTVSALQFAHNRGASIKITDAPALVFATNVFKGKQNIENPLTYLSSVSISSSTNQLVSANWVAGFAGIASSSAYNTLINSNNTWLGTNTYSAAVTNNAAVTFTSTATGIYDTASSSLVSNGRLADVSFAGTVDSSLTQKGIVEIATQLEAASSSSSGGTSAPIVIPASSATSTYNAATADLRLVVTQNNGKIDPYFIATSSLGLATASTSVFLGTTTQNWSKPTNAIEVCFLLIGGGGGGAARPNAASGAGGGGAGGLLDICLPTELVPTTISITVGGYGVGGKNYTVGEDGQVGASTTMTINGVLYEAGAAKATTITNTGGKGGVVLIGGVATIYGYQGGDGGTPPGGTGCASGGGPGNIDGVNTGCTAPAGYTGSSLAGAPASGQSDGVAGAHGGNYGAGGGPGNGAVAGNGSQGVIKITSIMANY